MRSVELFTGAGGLALGLERAGFKPTFMVEWDDHAYETIKENSHAGGPTHGWPFEHGDIRDYSFRNLGEIDLLAGGPPCQPFSIGGKHRGPSDVRDMWPEAIRAVREISPKFFLFENVRGLARVSFSEYLHYIVERLKHPMVNAKRGEHWSEHLERLSKISLSKRDRAIYRVEVHKVNAADYGAAQKRHRVIVLGVRTDIDDGWKFPDCTHSKESLVWNKYVTGDYWRGHRIGIENRLPPTDAEARMASRLDNTFTRPNKRPWVTVRDVIHDLPNPEHGSELSVGNHKFQPGARPYTGHTGSPIDEPAKALKAGDHGVPGGENMLAFANGRVRYFTVRESARLQGFPDNFVFPGSWTESMRQLGNAVPVPMATAIAEEIRSFLARSMTGMKSRRAA